MLIDFSVSNFRSVADKQIVSLVPESSQSDFLDNIITEEKHSALNVLAIYGPNNSGKSSLLQSLHLLIHLIKSSLRRNSTTKLPFQPNLLVEGFSHKPTELSVTFVLNKIRYRYGFSYQEDKILTEWLYRKKSGREVDVFTREGGTIDVSSALEGGKRIIDAAVEATRDNALFLSTGDAFNIAELTSILEWIQNIIPIDGLDTSALGKATRKFMTKEPDFISEINKYIGRLNLGIRNVSLSEPQENGDKVVLATHVILKEDGTSTNKELAWALTERESSGTQKIFQILGPVIVALRNGSLIVIDEIEAKLHTKLTSTLVGLFTNPETNPRQAQLIFATHDTNLLKSAKLRRDQINFVEKDKKGATQLYALSDFRYFDGNKERPDTDKEKRYLEGRYGATPLVSLKDLIAPN